MLQTTQPASMGRRRRICVIGAGVSGLVAAKVLSDYGHAVSVVEKSGDLGGVWEPARSYPGVRLQTPGAMYCYTDHKMTEGLEEWPTGVQVHAYLLGYAERFALQPLIRFDTEVVGLVRDAPGGWRVSLQSPGGAAEDRFDEVVVATGQFSAKRRLAIPGREAFEAAGSKALHSSEYTDPELVRGRKLVVVGYSKSATDVAMNALEHGAQSVTMVHRETAWKIPYFFGGLVNFKNILYCRASEAMFMPWAPGAAGRLARRLSAPLIWANWRTLELLLDRQYGLSRLKLRPRARIEETVHCATSIETPGFYKAIHDGRITLVRGSPTAYGPGQLQVGVASLPADLVIEAVGWEQALPFLDAGARAALVGADGQYRLHRMILNPDLPGLAFIGFNSSFITPLSAELGAHWYARYLARSLARQPDAAMMRASIDNQLAWKRQRPVAAGFGGLCVAPYHHAHFDELMRDMGARTRVANPVAAYLMPIAPAAYAGLLATAPPAPVPQPTPKESVAA